VSGQLLAVAAEPRLEGFVAVVVEDEESLEDFDDSEEDDPGESDPDEEFELLADSAAAFSRARRLVP
jgi:hypothetical protein